jgi:FtsH-binding integral membrane protein
MSDYDRSANARAGVGIARSPAAVDQGLRAYMLGVYNYMTLGLGLTGVVAYVAYKLGVVETATGHIVGLTGFGQAIYVSPLKWVVIFAPLALVFAISAGRNAMSVSTTRLVFLLFAALIGLSLSTVFVVFTQASIALVFFETAAAFGGLSLYGYTTSRSLSAMGSFLVMGLFGLIIASVVNIFLQSSGLQWALSIVGVGIFAGLTAWDTQAIKESYFAGDSYEASEKKAIYGALRLYLDFINMFQQLLFLMGNRRS